MATKRFRTARYWHNTLVMLWSVPFLILPGVIVAASSGNFSLLVVMLLCGLVAVTIAVVRDGSRTFMYELDEEQLIIVDGAVKHMVPMKEIIDGSLLDRAAVREFLRQHLQTGQRDQADAFAADLQRFCTMDIGLRSFTFGLGRVLIDRMPNAKSDLVLLRLIGGRALLLSPTHAQDFIVSLNRRKMV